MCMKYAIVCCLRIARIYLQAHLTCVIEIWTHLIVQDSSLCVEDIWCDLQCCVTVEDWRAPNALCRSNDTFLTRVLGCLWKVFVCKWSGMARGSGLVEGGFLCGVQMCLIECSHVKRYDEWKCGCRIMWLHSEWSRVVWSASYFNHSIPGSKFHETIRLVRWPELQTSSGPDGKVPASSL